MLFLCLVEDLKEHLKNKNKEPTGQKNSKNIQMLRKFLERDRWLDDEEPRKTFSDSICCCSQADKITFEDMLNALCGCQANVSSCISSKDVHIAIVGQTKVGKSNLAKILLEKLQDNFSYVFYVSGSQQEQKVNLLQFLTNSAFPPLPCFQKHMFQSILYKLFNESVCIVLDDIDKNSFSSNVDSRNICVFKKHESKYFFLNILEQKIFSNAKKVVILTPFDYVDLKNFIDRSKFTLINVLGIDTKAHQHLLKTMYPDFSCNVDDEKKNVLQCIALNHDIKTCSHAEVRSLCYVPKHFENYLQLEMGIEKFKSGSIKLSEMNAKSSAVYVLLKWLETTFQFCKINISESCNLDSIGRFAWEQLIEKQYFFWANIMGHLSRIEKNMFFVAFREPPLHTFCFCFSHILLQELLSALWLLCLSNDEFKRETKNRFGRNDHFAVVYEFMIAITTNQCLQEFQAVDPFWKINSDNVTLLRTVSDVVLEKT